MVNQVVSMEYQIERSTVEDSVHPVLLVRCSQILQRVEIADVIVITQISSIQHIPTN